MKLKRKTIFLLVFLFSVMAKSQEISNNTFGKGLINIVARDSSYSLKFATRFQTLYSSQWIFPEDETALSRNTIFLIRRARLSIDCNLISIFKI